MLLNGHFKIWLPFREHLKWFGVIQSEKEMSYQAKRRHEEPEIYISM